MFWLCKASARKLISKAKEVAQVTESRMIASTTASCTLVSANLSRTLVTMRKDVGGHEDLDAIFQRKRSLRSKIRWELKNMNPVQRFEEDKAIQDIVLESPWFKASKSLCAYISCPALREVDTSRIVSEILCNPEKGNTEMRKKLYVPRIEDRNSNMKMLKVSSLDDLIANSMTILEPGLVDADGNPREDVMLASDPVDLFILPGLAFDKSGRRLGRSGGYYDLFLKRYRERAKENKWNQPFLVALSYSLQILEDGAIPITPYDVPVDGLVSPAGFTAIRSAALRGCD